MELVFFTGKKWVVKEIIDGTDYFENLDILEIKKLCRIGITIHNFINAPLEKFSHLCYLFRQIAIQYDEKMI